MTGKFNIYVELKNAELKDDILQKISDDWTVNWGIVTRSQNSSEPELTDIAVTDNPKALGSISKKAAVIFLGIPPEKANFFASIEKPSVESVFKAVKRANSYKEITKQNEVSLFCEKENKESLESIAESLSVHIHQLQRQSEMRIALVDQMPVGIMGIDDENTIVLANPKAIEILGVEDIPIWGLSVDSLLTDAVGDFVRSESLSEMNLNRYGHSILIRKAPFILEDTFAGTILVLWKISENQ